MYVAHYILCQNIRVNETYMYKLLNAMSPNKNIEQFSTISGILESLQGYTTYTYLYLVN